MIAEFHFVIQAEFKHMSMHMLLYAYICAYIN